MKTSDVYSMVTDRIISKLNSGIVPWERGYSSVAPQNFITKKPYRGINYWITVCNNHSSPFYLSFKQVKELGGSVKAGEKGTPIVYWQILEKQNRNADGILEKKTIPLLKYYTVFNAEQTTGIDFPVIENKVPNITSLDKVLQNMLDKPTIREGQSYSPSYVPVLDEIRMPLKNNYHSAGRYYKTLFHELAHSTGASKRLNRDGIAKFDRFGSEQYSLEELIAELAASFAINYAGLEEETIDNSVAYIQGWLKALKNDNKLIFTAAKQAEKAWKFINNEIEIGESKKEAA